MDKLDKIFDILAISVLGLMGIGIIVFGIIGLILFLGG